MGLIEISFNDILSMIQSARVLGRLDKTVEDNPKKEFISQRKAYELFTKKKVDKWREKGYLNEMPLNLTAKSKKQYSIIVLRELEESERLYGFVSQSTLKKIKEKQND